MLELVTVQQSRKNKAVVKQSGPPVTHTCQTSALMPAVHLHWVCTICIFCPPKTAADVPQQPPPPFWDSVFSIWTSICLWMGPFCWMGKSCCDQTDHQMDHVCCWHAQTDVCNRMLCQTVHTCGRELTGWLLESFGGVDDHMKESVQSRSLVIWKTNAQRNCTSSWAQYGDRKPLLIF